MRIELSDATSHVDLHPLHYDTDGSAWQAASDDDRFVYPANAWVVGRIGGQRGDLSLRASSSASSTPAMHSPTSPARTWH